MRVTIQEIANRAGVSRGTVDRALNNRGRIKPDVAEKILSIANELGYKSPKKRKPQEISYFKIGVVTQLAKSSFTLPIKQGLKAAINLLSSRNIECLVKEIQGVDEHSQLAALEELEENNVDAIALMPVESEQIRKKIDELTEKGILVATFNSDSLASRRSWFIGLDNERSGKTAAGLMAKLTQGKGKLLAITGYFGNSVSSQRVDGFVKRLQDYPDLELIGVQGSFDEATEVKKIVLDALKNFDDLAGIVVFSSGQKGVIDAFNEQKVDQRPFVIVYDLTSGNIEGLKNNQIDFLIDQDGYTQGYKVLLLLAEQLVGKRKDAQEFYFTDIVIKTIDNI
jgi:ABC-type sugar transport system, periplasmic component